jgi:hypothetical protein
MVVEHRKGVNNSQDGGFRFFGSGFLDGPAMLRISGGSE